MGIAERHHQYYEYIRNPQLALCSDEVADLLRYYGIMDHEYDIVMEMVRASMFNEYAEYFEGDDDDDFAD